MDLNEQQAAIAARYRVCKDYLSVGVESWQYNYSNGYWHLGEYHLAISYDAKLFEELFRNLPARYQREHLAEHFGVDFKQFAGSKVGDNIHWNFYNGERYTDLGIIQDALLLPRDYLLAEHIEEPPANFSLEGIKWI